MTFPSYPIERIVFNQDVLFAYPLSSNVSHNHVSGNSFRIFGGCGAIPAAPPNAIALIGAIPPGGPGIPTRRCTAKDADEYTIKGR